MAKFKMPVVQATVEDFIAAMRKSGGISTRGFVHAMGGKITIVSAMRVAAEAQKKYNLKSRWVPLHDSTSQESFYYEDGKGTPCSTSF
jgi:hypothetical protein